MDPILLARILICAFFTACFLQSGIDKIVDWRGNLEWLTGHFAKTPLKGAVPVLLSVVTLLELSAGFVSGFGGIWLALGRGPHYAALGLGLSASVLTMLFTGQRIAKDYPGAATIATYFAVAMVGLFVMK